MAAPMVDVRLWTVIRVSSSSDRCLIVSHNVCRVVTFNHKKLIVVERCRSNHCVNNGINVFRFMEEQKYACGKQPKIRILQQVATGRALAIIEASPNKCVAYLILIVTPAPRHIRFF